MNLPGFPAGVIMPCIGVLIAQSSLSLPLTLVLSVASGLLGSLVIYGLCYWGGEPIMEKLFGKSRKFRSFVQKCHEFIDAQHGRGLALCRIIPMLRTIVSGHRHRGVEYRAHLRRVSVQRQDTHAGDVRQSK